MSARKLIVISDTHLGTTEGDSEELLCFIDSLSPDQTELLFLGDLFHIWAGPEKYRTAIVRHFMEKLFEFRDNGGIAHLIAGNRDAFLPEKQGDKLNDLYPFHRIALNVLELSLEGGKLIAVHGDTINSKDKQYLRWRALIRSRPFRWSFNLIPAKRVKKILLMLEENLKKTNMAFRSEFPEEEWQVFLDNIRSIHNPKLLIAGHYHPQKAKVYQLGNMTSLIIPAWCENRTVLEIEQDMTYSFKATS